MENRHFALPRLNYRETVDISFPYSTLGSITVDFFSYSHHLCSSVFGVRAEKEERRQKVNSQATRPRTIQDLRFGESISNHTFESSFFQKSNL